MIEMEHFRHYVTETEDLGVRKLLATYGATGYGVYWYILEKIYKYPKLEIVMNGRFWEEAKYSLLLGKRKMMKILKEMDDLMLITISGSVIMCNRATTEVALVEAAVARRAKRSKV